MYVCMYIARIHEQPACLSNKCSPKPSTSPPTTLPHTPVPHPLGPPTTIPYRTTRTNPLPILVLFLFLPFPPHQPAPKLSDPYPLGGQHAVLQPIQILPMYRRYEASRQKAQGDGGGEVVFAEAGGELEVFVED